MFEPVVPQSVRVSHKSQARRTPKPTQSRRAFVPRLERLEGRDLLAIYVVNSLVDDGGAGTLRHAITQANSTPFVPDDIRFAIGLMFPARISLQNPLPAITDSLVIDATTEPIYQLSPVVELYGGNVAVASDGLRAVNTDVTIKGLAIVSFEQGCAIRLEGGGNSKITRNYLGRGVAPAGAGANVYGVCIVDSPDNQIGGTSPIPGVAAQDRNVISNNAGEGVWITGADSVSNRVQGNYIGVSTSGKAAEGNTSGILINDGATRNLVGVDPTSPAWGDGNVISANTTSGIRIVAADLNRVHGNLIGTNEDSSTTLGNSKSGVFIVGGSSNEIGTRLQFPEANTISANGGDGIRISKVGVPVNVNNKIQGNWIGTDRFLGQLGNKGNGVLVESGKNVVGGVPFGNHISFNGDHGVHVLPDANKSTVEGNVVEDNKGKFNILVESKQVNVAQNKVRRGAGAGIGISGDDNVLLGNEVASNQEVGVSVLSGTRTTINGNSIVNNGGTGVRVLLEGQGTLISQNSIYDNGSLGIDIGLEGPTLTGVPVLCSVVVSGNSTTIRGCLNSTPITTFTLEFFVNDEPDPSSYGEGESFLGSTTVTTDGSGQASFTVTFPVAVSPNAWITTTATDPAGNTTEFSKAKQANDQNLQWSLFPVPVGGEASVSQDTVTMGVPRNENGFQNQRFHGAYTLLPPAAGFATKCLITAR